MLDQSRRLLDRPSEPHPILSALMDGAIRAMAMGSDGATVSLTVRTSGGGGGNSRAPVSALAQEIDEVLGRFMDARTHRGRLKAIKEAQDRATFKFDPDRSKIQGTPEWKAAILQDPRSCRVVAAEYGIDKMTVSRMRSAARKARCINVAHDATSAYRDSHSAWTSG